MTALALTAACKSSEESAGSGSEKAAKTPGQATKATKADDASPAEVLKDPSKATLTAPAEYTVELTTTKGKILMDVKRAWAPKGADRFYNLVKAGFYDDVAFFRVIQGFMAQVGIHGDPSVAAVWRRATFEDDPVKESNKRGMVSFATAGPNTRTTQFFINFGDNSNLDGMGFAPFAKVRDMTVVDQIHAGYGEGAPRGAGPSQGLMQQKGNSYLKESFPKLDYIESARVVTE